MTITKSGDLRCQGAIIEPPVGHHWGRDALGVFVQKNGMGDEGKYHPSVGQAFFAKFDQGKFLIERCEKNLIRDLGDFESRHLKKERVNKIKNHPLFKKVVVKTEDSYAAGNCQSGTASWLNQHNISDTSRPLTQIINLSTDDRFIATLEEAIKRTERDETNL